MKHKILFNLSLGCAFINVVLVFIAQILKLNNTYMSSTIVLLLALTALFFLAGSWTLYFENKSKELVLSDDEK